MRNFGMNVDLFSYRCNTNIRGLNGHKAEALKQQYNVYHLEEAPNLYGVFSEFQGVPNFMVWNHDQTWVDWINEPMSIDAISKAVAPYLANMTEEEEALFLPIIQQMGTLYNVFHISAYDHAIELHTNINGRSKRLLITVMNMMDFTRDPNCMRHSWSRDTLN